MSWQIIKRPDGKFCLYSPRSECIIWDNLTREEVISKFENNELERLYDRLNRIFLDVKSGHPERTYYQFTVSFEDAIVNTATKMVKDDGISIETLIKEYPIMQGEILKKVKARLAESEVGDE